MQDLVGLVSSAWLINTRVNPFMSYSLRNGSFKKAIEGCRDLGFSQVLTNLFKILSCWPLYRFRKYLKSWLVVQNLRIVLIKMFISSKLFVWHSSRKIVRLELSRSLSYSLSILTIFLDKCQTKSFEDMSVLMKTILKFCITNQLFKYLLSEKPL